MKKEEGGREKGKKEKGRKGFQCREISRSLVIPARLHPCILTLVLLLLQITGRDFENY